MPDYVVFVKFIPLDWAYVWVEYSLNKFCLFPGVLIGAASQFEACRVAPYVSVGALRMPFQQASYFEARSL